MQRQTLFLLYFSTFFYIQAYAQPTLQWAQRFNGSIGNDRGKALAVDNDGNVYFAGSSDGSNFMSDYLLVKYNSDGDTLWSRRYDGSANGIDVAVAVKVDASGNVYTTGYSQSAGLGYDIVTLKYNAQGILQWAKVFDGGNNGANKDDMGYNLEIDIAGNVYVAGSSFPIGATKTDGVVIKYNSAGTLLWKININEMSNPEVTNLIRINSLGNIIVTEGGEIYDSYKVIELNPSNGSTIKRYNIFTAPEFLAPVLGYPEDLVLDYNNNMYVVSSANQFGLLEVHTAKFSRESSGTRAWDSFNQVSGSSMISGIGIDIDLALNTYVLSDYYNGANHFIRLRKYNPSGATQWVKTFSSANPGVDNVPVSLSLGREVSNPSIFVAGYTALGDITLVEFDNNGDTLWQRIYDCGNNGPDIASMMITDKCDNIYITGHSNCSGTNQDVKTIKYSTKAPKIMANKLIPVICQGDSLVLESSDATAYQWNTGDTTQKITVKTAGNYLVTATYSNGCTAASPAVMVSVNPLPPSPVIFVVNDNPTIFCQGGVVTLASSPASSYLWSNGATTPSITVSTSGQYSVTVGNAAGCTAASLSAVPVTVLPLPTALIIPGGPTTFCQGGSVTLASSQASSYLWSNGATTPEIAVSTAGQYSVTVTDINGCTDASDAMSVAVLLLPVANITPPGPVSLCEGQSVTLTAGTASAYDWSNGDTTQMIHVSATGSYTVTVTGTNTCTAVSAATLVVVNPLPEVSITTNDTTTFCEGGVATLTSSPASSYQWSNGAETQSITVSTSGDYSVTITDNKGCTDVSSSVTVTVLPLPVVNLGKDTMIQGGQTATLDASGQGLTYLWSTGETTPAITVDSMGTYSVTVTNGFNCTATDSIIIIILSSAADTEIKYKITVFPNPVQRTVNVRCTGSATTSAQVFDYLGKLVSEDASFAPDGAIRTLFLANEPAGTYYVRIKGDKFTTTIPVFKKY